MSEIATAFVRIRPNMSGFDSEVQSGVSSAFSKAAKIAGVAFGAKEVFDFGTSIVEHASDVQKQIEAVRAEFGAASKSIFDFGEKGGVALGISAHLADTTAARFGILFKNIGIGPELAAKMTVNFEKLAGSISQIRNIDPATVLANLPLAVAGNLRSLKQLGIAVDQNTLKVAAFKLGLISSISQALTPAQRALAIYAVGTAHLGEFQKQAGQHSEDLANRMRRLRAEFDNAKDELGTKLLPVATQLVGFLSDKLPGALKGSETAIHDLSAVVHEIVGPLGGARTAVLDFLAVFAVAKLVAFGNGIRTQVIANGVKLLSREFQVAEKEVIASYSGMELATIGLATTIKGALISTGIGALIVAAGLAAEYVITHWSKVKRWFAEFAGWLRTALAVAWAGIREGAKEVAYRMLQYFTLAIRGILEVAAHLPFIGKFARRALNDIQGALDAFKPDFSNVTNAFSRGGAEAGAAYANALRKQLAAEAKTFGGTLPALSALLGKQVNDAVSAAVLDRPKTDIGNTDLSKQVVAQQNLLDQLNKQLLNANASEDAGVRKIREKLATLGRSLTDAVAQENRDLKAAVDQAKSNLGSLGQSLAQQISAVLDKPIEDAQTKINELQNRQSLENIRRSVILPGGRELSKDPKQALAELQALARQGGNVNRAAINDFITQYRTAALGVQQDQVNRVKANATQRISDLTDAFNRGQLSLGEYKKRVLGVLTADHVSYRRAGELLGTAFANGFRDTVKGILEQAAVINVSPKFTNVIGSSIQIIRPLEAIRDDQKQVATIQRQIRDQHGALQTRIAKAAEKQAALLEKIHAVQLGPTAGDVTKDSGHNQRRQKNLSGTGG